MIRNITKNTVLANSQKVCDSDAEKAAGLMFASKLRDNAIVFRFNKAKKIALHMFFVFQTIDVVLLDEKNKVIELKQNFRPFSFFNSRNSSRLVLELPEGTIGKSRTEARGARRRGWTTWPRIRATCR